jgi:hypothetical protein
MLRQEDKIRLIHQYRTSLLDHMFDELWCGRRTGLGSDSGYCSNYPERAFVLALQQVVDSFIAGLLTNEAFQ